MPRAKEFDETEVLEKALELFRARGFKHTSFDDLTRELGVSRQSLYDTYGDKNTLYHAALKRYLDRGLGYFSRTLDDEAPIKEVVGRLFEGILENQCSKNATGCLMVNTMVELSPHDQEIRALLQGHARAIESLFLARFSAAKRKGQISRSKDPLALAQYFHNILLGIGVGSRALGNPDALRATVAVALTVLD